MASYNDLYAAVKRRYTSILTAKGAIQRKCNEIWYKLKAEYKDESLRAETAKKIEELDGKTTRSSLCYKNYFVKVIDAANEHEQSGIGVQKVVSSNQSSSSGPKSADKKGKRKTDTCTSNNDDATDQPSSKKSYVYPKPRQESLQKEICLLESELNTLVTKRDLGLAPDGIEKDIKDKRLDLEVAKKTLKNKQSRTVSSQKQKDKKRNQLIELQAANPESSIILFRGQVGRPRLEYDQKGLVDSICDILMHFGSASDKRRTPSVRSASSLDDAVAILQSMGFETSRSAVYLRLIPRDSTTIQGRRHVKTCPVRLCKAQNDHHKEHADQYFCRATISGLQQIASILGPEKVCIISQDNKAKVPIGITAAKSQSSILMHVDYKVRLPDHDFAPGPRHNLVPSVYAGLVIKENMVGDEKAVTNSGPTYVAVRSGKHSSATASTHAKDLDRLYELKDFQSIMKTKDGTDKPILILFVDGGPDENPRYLKVRSHASIVFVKRKLDALFICTNAPGRSAFNPVDRRMAPLSKALSGLVLSPDFYGKHLDNNGETVDLDLEKQNFQHAGEMLAVIWSEIAIDGHNVSAEFMPCDEVLPEPSPCSYHQWYANHVRESQYLLQIIKCNDKNCCSTPKSNIKQILYQNFLPAPFPINQDPLSVPPPSDQTMGEFPSFLVRQSLTLRPFFQLTKEIPYDYYCPSIQREINGRICPDCGLYFASKTSVDLHKKNVHKIEAVASRVRPLKVFGRRPGEVLCTTFEDTIEWIDVELVDDSTAVQEVVETDDTIPVIEDITSWINEGIAFTNDC